MQKEDQFKEGIKRLYRLLIALFTLLGAVIMVFLILYSNPGIFKNFWEPSVQLAISPAEDIGLDEVIDGVHQRTGLVEGEGLMTVVNNCTNCHSAKIIIQNRMNEERWKATIRWMQETQNLWELGDNEDVIINYLVTNYPIEQVGRRQILTNIDWYDYSE